ncbi:MAG: phosphoribosyltransferase [Anaerolineae bacterium]|nr:phosphoribosyltransferase [Anaerolineae bacterium]MCB9459325.1 phosphoribosyltransferase [Anaerolineaceae bacterium]
MSDKVALSFEEISERLHSMDLPDVDRVVGIATGGASAAVMLAHQLRKPMTMLFINFRAPDNSPQRPGPELLKEPDLPNQPERILLVDDVSVSGRTMDFAKSLLEGHDVTTFVLKGHGDYVAFPTVASCVHWPWKPE